MLPFAARGVIIIGKAHDRNRELNPRENDPVEHPEHRHRNQPDIAARNQPPEIGDIEPQERANKQRRQAKA